MPVHDEDVKVNFIVHGQIRKFVERISHFFTYPRTSGRTSLRNSSD
jgi:hypothetical protein